jgi:hypothetical protein
MRAIFWVASALLTIMVLGCLFTLADPDLRKSRLGKDLVLLLVGLGIILGMILVYLLSSPR